MHRIELRQFVQAVYVPARIDLSADWVAHLLYAARMFTLWLGRSATLADLTEESLRQFLAATRQRRSAATTNSLRGTLLGIWRCAWEEGHLPQPPRTSRIRKAREEIRVPEAWTPEEVGRILAAAESTPGMVGGIPARDWWPSILLAAYDTGERRGALLKTPPGDVSLADGWVLFRRTKTGKHRLCQLAADALEAITRIYDPCRPRLWPWSGSMPALNRRLMRILKRAGVPYGRARGGCWHKFRRTAGTLVEANGGDGARFIGDTRAVFERHYKDPRFFGAGDLSRLPRPMI